MTFLLDHDVPDAVARVLQQAGHQACRLRELAGADITDAVVLELAREREMLLVTCNRDDFLALAQTQPHPGIIILIRRTSRMAECSQLLRLLQTAGEAGLRANINFA